MTAADKQDLENLIQLPHGIILVTGPTGSGKSTTLYAILSALNTPGRNILTVEDPVEYELEGIGQTQVNTRVDMSFARGLRAILRQDRMSSWWGKFVIQRPHRLRFSLAHRPSGALNTPHQQCIRRSHPATRHGRRIIPAFVFTGRDYRATSGSSPVSAMPTIHARITPTSADV